MKVSLITVCYNADSTIRDTLVSVLSQTYSDLEYIVIDGQSTDKTQEILKEYSCRISKIVCEPDNGLYDAMNKGIKIAQGDIVGFLNADDIFENEHALTCIVDQFSDKSIDACYTDLTYVSENLSTVKRFWHSGEYKEAAWESAWVPPHPTFYARQEVYKLLGGFDLDFKLAADYEILFRFLMIHKVKVKYLPKVTVNMRVGGVTNRSINNILAQNREIFLVWDKYNLKLNKFKFSLSKIALRLKQRFFNTKNA